MSDEADSFFLPPDVRELVDADRAAPDPPQALKRDLARRLERRIGLAAFALGATEAKTAAASMAPATSAGLKAATGLGAAWKWTVGASVALAIGGGIVPMASSRIGPTLHGGKAHAASVRSFESTSKDTLITPSTSSSSQPLARAVEDSRRPSRTGTGRTPPAPVDQLGEERALLDGARRALLQHDASGALQTIQLHERLFQHGELVQERESMRIKALVASGDYAAARSAGERFRHRYAHSVLLAVVEKTLEGIP